MTPRTSKKVTIIDAETGERIREGIGRSDDTEFRMTKSLFGLSRDTVVKLVFALIAGGVWYANDLNFKNTVVQYMGRQDNQNQKVDTFIENSDNFHSSVFKTRFKQGTPLNQGYETKDNHGSL